MALYAFDGTWNQERNAGEYDKNTNVVKFSHAYAADKHGYKGVGTKLGWIGRVVGGAFGAGGKERIANAYRDLCARYLAGDRDIDIIGFSRGAALSLHFTTVIHRKGIRDPASGRLVAQPRIRFVGLWDVVASFGIPFDFGIPFNRINLGYRLTLAPIVDHCCHALALDERRQTFRVTRVDNGYEVWFRGVHSDVGGGNENTGLNHISLRWMMRKAVAVGLPLDRTAVAALDASIDPAAAVHKNPDVIKNRKRELRPNDRVHYTVSLRAGDELNNPSPGSPVETAALELQV